MCNTDSILQIQKMYYIYVKYRYPGLMYKVDIINSFIVIIRFDEVLYLKKYIQ